MGPDPGTKRAVSWLEPLNISSLESSHTGRIIVKISIYNLAAMVPTTICPVSVLMGADMVGASLRSDGHRDPSANTISHSGLSQFHITVCGRFMTSSTDSEEQGMSVYALYPFIGSGQDDMSRGVSPWSPRPLRPPLLYRQPARQGNCPPSSGPSSGRAPSSSAQ